MGVSEWWSSVITRACEQQKSEALVAWEDMREIKAQLAEALAEAQEQARLLGMSAERELALQAQLAEERAENERLKHAAAVVTNHLQWYVEEDGVVQIDPEPLRKLATLASEE